jgi:hypothetical protein
MAVESDSLGLPPHEVHDDEDDDPDDGIPAGSPSTLGICTG